MLRKGGKMSAIRPKIDLGDREHIEIGLYRKQPIKRIAAMLKRHTSSITNEILKYRIFVKGSYVAGNDCKYARGCTKRHICGDKACPFRCFECIRDCHQYCNDYQCSKCKKYENPPYVCNGCDNRRYCTDDRYFYDGNVAEKKSREIRASSRQGIHLTDEELKTVNEVVCSGIKKGQPLSHIMATHEEEIPVTERTIYTYIGNSVLDIRNIDMRRRASYKRRRKKRGESSVLTQKFRQGRSHQDFLELMKTVPEYKVFEMDTVKGKQGLGKVMLTMLFRKNSVMLIFIMPDCKAESVKERFDYLEQGLGQECFKRLFRIGLTDNGSEFKRVDDLENSCLTEGNIRTSLYYCDPMQSGQKGRLEKNHEFIRYVIPKGTSLNPYTQDDMTLLMNHINSTKRPGLDNKSPYDLISEDDEDMHRLMKLLDLKPIPADEVNLTKNLLRK